MSKFSRSERDQRLRDERLARLWRQGMPGIAIAAAMGYSSTQAVSHAVRRLGLAPRSPNRDIRPAFMERMGRIAAEQEALDERAKRLHIPPRREELPTCFVCHGRSQSWDGHPQCRGRGRRVA